VRMSLREGDEEVEEDVGEGDGEGDATARAKWKAVARPMPEEAPVMRMVLLRRREAGRAMG